MPILTRVKNTAARQLRLMADTVSGPSPEQPYYGTYPGPTYPGPSYPGPTYPGPTYPGPSYPVGANLAYPPFNPASYPPPPPTQRASVGAQPARVDPESSTEDSNLPTYEDTVRTPTASKPTAPVIVTQPTVIYPSLGPGISSQPGVVYAPMAAYPTPAPIQYPPPITSAYRRDPYKDGCYENCAQTSCLMCYCFSDACSCLNYASERPYGAYNLRTAEMFLITKARNSFVGKVCGLQAVILLFMTSVTSALIYLNEVVKFVQNNKSLVVLASLTVVFFYCAFLFWDSPRRRRAPGMYTSLICLVLSETFFLAILSSFYDSELAVWITGHAAVANIAVAIFCCNAKQTLYSFGYGTICVVLAILTLGIPGIVLWVTVYRTASTILTPIYGVLLALVYCLDQLISLSMIIDGWRGPMLTANDHVYVTLQLHLYMVTCFFCNSILVCGKCFDFCC